MGKIIEVQKSDIKYWLENFRFGHANDQEEAGRLLRETKGFDAVVKSIREHGYLANNLITIAEDKREKGRYIVFDGNRRLAALQQIPELTKIYAYQEEDPVQLNAILQIEHSKHPAGQIKWTPIQQARYEMSRFVQKISEKVPSDVIALAILEKTLEKPADMNFPLTTFERILGAKDAMQKFGISASDVSAVMIDKIAELRVVVDDIAEKLVSSRNTNTSENIQKYIDCVLSGKNKDERLASLKNDTEDNDEEANDQDRLFNATELQMLRPHLKNDKFIEELQRAPTTRYPHLLFLATRTVIDSLGNVCENRYPPISLNSSKAVDYLQQHNEKFTTKVKSLIDSLGESAHSTLKKRTRHDIENNSALVNKLATLICNAIQKKQGI